MNLVDQFSQLGPEATIAATLWSEVLTTAKPPPKLNLIEWADTGRFVSSKNSASPGRWKTSAQPCAFGPMEAVTRADTHTVTIMAGTQVLKTEFLINVCSYYVAQDPAAILFVQPTQGVAEDFSKERFAPTVEITPQLRELIDPPRARNSFNTITHKEFPGGTLDFVGANSPTDLASRPKRIILCDEIDKYPISAGSEGDPRSAQLRAPRRAQAHGIELHRVGASTRTQRGARHVCRCARDAQGAAARDLAPAGILGHARHCAGRHRRTGAAAARE
jgi:phage terminase large subunit GpA-like protein